MCPKKDEPVKHSSKRSTGETARPEEDPTKWQFAPDNKGTQRLLKALSADDLTLEESPTKTGATPFNPYDKTTLAPTKEKQRRSLDDMRKLSEHIKKSKPFIPPTE